MSDDNTPFPKRVPEFSRAVDDSEDSDWDEAEAGEAVSDALANCVLRLGPEARAEMALSEGGRLDCSTLLVGVGPAACGFLTACLLHGGDARVLGLISCGFPDVGIVNSLGQTGLGDWACLIYRLGCNPQVLLCHAMSPVAPADCHAFAERLLSVVDIDSVDVAVFSTSAISGYQSGLPTSALPCPLLRCLRTSAAVVQKSGGKAAAPAVPQLEPPNLLTGLSAQLLSVCQMRRVPAAAFVSYLAEPESRRSDAEAMASFRAALACEPVRLCRTSWPKDSELVMRQLAGQPLPQKSHSSTVYI